MSTCPFHAHRLSDVPSAPAVVRVAGPTAVREPPVVRGLPWLGNALQMAKDPGRFFADCYRTHGPVFRISVLGTPYTVLAGAEAAAFVAGPEGKASLRSKEFWRGLVSEYGATRMLVGEDGDTHKALRDVVKRGYSRTALAGRHDWFVGLTDECIDRDWRPGRRVPVLASMESMVIHQLGMLLTGTAPHEYVEDIRTSVRYILNVLVTRQRPKIMLRMPEYRRSRARVLELGRKLISDWHARRGDEGRERNLVDDIMEAHLRDPELLPERDLVINLIGPFLAGLDTVANANAALVYTILKHPDVHARVQAEVDRLFAGGPIDEARLQDMPALQGAIMETMRLYPMAVALMRTATRDFVFANHRVRAGELVYVATCVPHFLPEYFDEPEKFDIDRYEKPRAEHMRPGAYSPFGRGAHACLGKHLALAQIALSVARLFHRLELELDSPDYTLRTKTAPSPGPARSFCVRVRGPRRVGAPRC
jgi:cytochrome P450